MRFSLTRALARRVLYSSAEISQLWQRMAKASTIMLAGKGRAIQQRLGQVRGIRGQSGSGGVGRMIGQALWFVLIKSSNVADVFSTRFPHISQLSR